MKYSWTKKWNKFNYGIIMGLICPVVGFFIAYFVIGNNLPLSQFTKHLFSELSSENIVNEVYKEMRQNTLMFCLLTNMLVFYFSFFIFKIDKFSKGIVGLTLLLAAFSVLFIY